MRIYKNLAKIILLISIINILTLNGTAKANVTANQNSQVKTFIGVVTNLIGNRVIFKTTSAASYDAETSTAQLLRKNGLTMNLLEINIGDKVEVVGVVWPDNSINVTRLKNLSLYPHASTFTGKITNIDPQKLNFTINNRQHGTQQIQVTNATTFTKSKSASTFSDLEIGWTATVKGTWERSASQVSATKVQSTVRYLKLEFTGTIIAKTNSNLTVLANNVIYGVNINKAVLKNAKNKTINFDQFSADDRVKVQGKHIPEGVQVDAIKIQNLSLN